MSLISSQGDSLSYGVDYFGFLETVLRDLKGYRTLAHELVQNADDATGTSTLSFDVRDDDLIVANDGSFADCGHAQENECSWRSDTSRGRSCDFHRFRQIASGGKRVEDDTIGAFGIGFLTVYQITDRPEIVSSGRHWIVEAESQRIAQCRGCATCTGHGSDNTRFIFPWARNPESLLRRRLRVEPVTPESPRKLLEELIPTVPLAMLFLKRLRHVSISQNGQRVKSFEVEVDQDNDCLIVSDGTTSTMWHRFHANFDESASRLRKLHGSRIEDKRSSNVTIAVPDEPIDNGVFCAFLPTQQKTGLPFHINADFYPTSNRKEIVLESDYQAEWNRVAINAAARALAQNLERVRDSVGAVQLWNIIAAADKVARDAESNRCDTAMGQFSECLAERLSSSSIVYSSKNQWVAPSCALFLEREEEVQSLAILEGLGLDIVHSDLRFAQNVLVSRTVGVRLLDGLALAAGLLRCGLNHRTDPQSLPDFLRPEAAWTRLWEEVSRLLEQLGRRDRARQEPAIRELERCAIALARDGAYWPCVEVFQANEATIRLFHGVLPDIPYLEREAASVNALQQLCPTFNAATAIEKLSGLPTGAIESAVQEGRLDLRQLLGWFEDERASILRSPKLTADLAALPIFPSASGPKRLSDLSLPGDFVDPVGLAGVVDLDSLGGRGDFLRELGAEELTFENYAAQHVPRFLNEESPDPTRLRALIRLLADNLGRIRDDDDIRQAFAAVSLVECLDGVFRPAGDTYFSSEVIQQVLGSTVPRALVPPTHGNAISHFYRWMGVETQPRLAEIVARIGQITDDPPDEQSVLAIRTLFEHLGGRLDSSSARDRLLVLKNSAWLPARGDRSEWHRAAEVYADFNAYLFESQALFLDVPQRVQQATVDLLQFLAIKTAPIESQVVAHLLHCSNAGTMVNKEVYRWLNDRHDHSAVAALVGSRCLVLPNGSYTSPDTVFWADHPFGHFRHKLGTELRRYNDLFTRVGVLELPDHRDALRVINEIAIEFGAANRVLDGEVQAVLLGCWQMLERALDSEAIDSAQLADLRQKKVVCNATSVLNPAEWMFFDDRAGLASKFGGVLQNNVIPKPLGAWRALAAAGVRPLSEAVQTQLVECTDPVDDESVAACIEGRRSQIGRVVDFHAPGHVKDLARLTELRFMAVQELKILHHLRTFSRDFVSEPESIHAQLHAQSMILYFVRVGQKPPWGAIARELARFLCPDVEPGQLAPGIKEALAADSLEYAEAALDELGVSRVVELSIHGVSDGSTVDDLGGETAPDQLPFLSSGHGSGIEKPNTGSAPQTVEDVIQGILGPNSEPTTLPSQLQQPDSVGNVTGHVGAGHGDTNGSPGPGTPGKSNRQRTRGSGKLRTYVSPTESPGDGPSDSEQHLRRTAVDQAGIRRVLDYERQFGRNPREMPPKHPGYDIESSDKEGTIERYIEVKSLSGDWGDSGAALTKTQFDKALLLADNYWLYIVERAETDDFCVRPIRDPARQVNQFIYDDGWQALAPTEAG